MKCNSDWTVTQHVENMCMIQDELTAVNASVRGPLFTQMIIRSLRANSRFDRLIGMVEIGDDKFDTPDKLKEQRRRKHLERGITKKNQVVYLDLLYPKYSASLKPYKTVLVVVGEYSRYTNVYLLYLEERIRGKKAIKRYVTLAERQFSDNKVRKVVSDGGG
ncbi:unnamed protein product [Peronospora belbahrii]|uniref:Uncharacterized protein n=1 Tax=Peronospora belbahrii TaxID=622444 RepID=A0ABN8CRB6_9STRA|nr:unnamed protein product [Peronospora belbahrii]